MWLLKNKVLQLVVIMLISLAVYWPGMTGGFYFDDEWNILQNAALQIDDLSVASINNAAASGRAGPLGRPIAMASFAINYYFSGFDPFIFKLINLIIHLITSLGVFFLSMGLASLTSPTNNKNYQYLALLTTTFWLLHPLNNMFIPTILMYMLL